MKRTTVFLVVVGLLVGAVAAQAAIAQTTLSGHFVTIWPNTPDGEEPPRYFLIEKTGRWVELEIGEVFKELRSFDRKQVTVEGSYEEPLAATDAGAPQAQTAEQKFRVRSILPDKESFAPMATDMMAAQAAVSGSKPYATLLCRFADSVGTTPRERPWFDGLMAGSAYPSMDHFWRELSYDQVNFVGSGVFGWYNLPRPRSYYVSDTNGDGQEDADIQRLTDDCVAVADAEVYFPQYAGIDFVFNERLGCCAWGGPAWLELDGSGKIYGATWLPPWAMAQTTIVHERGHTLGLPHSSGPYNTAYDSSWDPMSGAFYDCAATAYGCIAPHTIAFHKADLLGWISPERQYTAAPGSSQTIEIERLAQPVGTGYLMARVPINGSETEFYTVEARKRVGYDSPLPDNVVLIHHVDTINRWDRQAQVVDVDNNGDPGDGGAMWTPGETFVGVGGVSVSVVSATANGFSVTISNGGAPPPPPTQFTLTTGKSGNGTVTAPGISCGGDCQEQFQDGAVVTLSASPDAGWTFSGWSGDADCADGQVVMLRDITCFANFSPEPRPNLLGWFTSLKKKVKKGSERASFSFVLQNNGERPVYGGFDVEFYLSNNAVLDGSDTHIATNGVSNKKGLAPGKSVKVKGKKVFLPLPGSGKYLLAVIDAWSVVQESNEGDNVVAIQIP